MRRISPRTLRTMKSPSPTSSRLPSVEVSVMICSTALEASSIRMPCCMTARGRRASTRLMRFCTSTEARLESVPGMKLAMISTWPSESLVDSKFRMPAAPFSSSSIRRVTLLYRFSGEAPGYEVLTEMEGGAMIGYCATASSGIEMAPIRQMNSATTQAKTGRSMKKLGIGQTSVPGHVGARLGRQAAALHAVGPGPRLHLVTRRKLLESLDNDLLAALQPLEHHPQPSLDRSDAYRQAGDRPALLDEIEH